MRSSVLILSLSLAAPAFAQTALIREEDPAPDGTLGRTVRSIGVAAVNQAGGYACTMTTGGFALSNINEVWGNLDGGAGTVLRTESQIGDLVQTQISSFFGISEASVAYMAQAWNTVTSAQNLNGVWQDDIPLAIEDDPVPGTNLFWVGAERPGLTQSGIPYFIGVVTDTQGGLGSQRGLYLGDVTVPIYNSGQSYPNLPVPLSSRAVESSFRFSAMGNHHIAPLDLDTSDATDRVVAIDGAGLVLDGTLTQESRLIPASIGGIGDRWAGFGAFGINESGDYVFTARTDADVTRDWALVRNGAIWAREGDTLGGEVLATSFEAASLNENGELAFVTEIEDGAGGTLDALYFEDRVLLKEGDEVDWDGDGVLDPAVVIDRLTPFNAIALALDGTIYFTADVTVGFDVLTGFFAIPARKLGTGYCAANPNSTGAVGRITAVGNGDVSDNDVRLTASSLPTESFGLFLTSQTQGVVMNPMGSQGNLCLGGSIGRYVGPGEVQWTGATGTASLELDLTATPDGSSIVSIQAGETWSFQCWYRDRESGVATSNLTHGVAIAF
jgi:hypothetical protein